MANVPASPQSHVASYLPALIRAGLGANQSLLYLRGEWGNLTPRSREQLSAANIGKLDSGLSPRRQTFLRLYSETAATLGRRDDVAIAEPNRRPVASEISKWPAKKPGGFLYQVLVAVQRQSGEVYFTQSAYFSPSLVEYAQAMSEAVDVFIQAQNDHDSFKGERILGPGFVTAVSEFVPE